MNIVVGPTGSLVQGTLFDSNKSVIERSLQAYDNLLYITWNPTKYHNMGCWELRRRPEQKSVVETIEYKGTNYHVLAYHELDIVNHVFDLPVLCDQIIIRLKKSDMWATAGYDGTNKDKITSLLDKIEDNRYAHQDSVQKKGMDDAVYALQQDRRLLNNFKDDILSGLNPAEIFRYWK